MVKKTKRKNSRTSYNQIDRKLEYLKEGIHLGSFDTTILSLMFFIMGFFFSIISIGLKAIEPFTELYIWVIFTILFGIPTLLISIWIYTLSIFGVNARFTNKKNVILLLEGFYYTSGTLLLLLYFFTFLEKRFFWVTPLIVNFGTLFFLTTIIFFILKFRRKSLKIYFEKNFKEHFRLRKLEIEKELKIKLNRASLDKN